MIETPFTIAIDTAEVAYPFMFEGYQWDADKKHDDMLVRTVFKNLGRHPNSWGDYSIIGHEKEVCVERKTVNDYISTVLGWNKERETAETIRRERFESELGNLSEACSCVVVEGDYLETLGSCFDTPNKSATINAKIVDRSTLAYMQDFRVPIIFAGSREAAERVTLRWFVRWWKHHGGKSND